MLSSQQLWSELVRLKAVGVTSAPAIHGELETVHGAGAASIHQVRKVLSKFNSLYADTRAAEVAASAESRRRSETQRLRGRDRSAGSTKKRKGAEFMSTVNNRGWVVGRTGCSASAIT